MAADRGPAPARRSRPASVRVRTTFAAVGVVGLALVAGAVGLVLVLRTTLTNEVRTAARHRADDVAVALAASDGEIPALGAADDDDDVMVQVLDDDGTVLAASRDAPADRPVARLRPGTSARVRVPGEDDDFLAVARVADTSAGPLVVLVARTLEDVTESTGVVIRLLVPGIPALLLVVGATTWRITGRALAPVEAIRDEVEGISAAELHRRVPVPAGSDEIARLAVTMNSMLDRLEAAAARQRRFIADASHELRSPVAAIRQHAEVARAHPDRTSTDELAGTVVEEILRLQGLVDDLLLLVRADEHGLVLRARPVDVDDLVFEEAARLRDSSGLQVDTRAVSAGRVAGDPAALRRVVRNLGDNAARHARGRVALSLSEDGGTVRLAVEDDGEGVPGPERERVFERFVRLDEARARDGGGAGLGLAIVRDVVAAHGGTAHITAGGLGGARVEVRLPASPDPPAPGAVQPAFRAPVTGSSHQPSAEEAT